MSILELLKPSDKTALIQGNARVTYAQLLDKGLSFGGCLRREGIGMGSYVLVFVPLSIELYIAMIGAWSIGAVPIFIDFSRGAKFVNDSVERLKPDRIVCDRVTSLVRGLYSKMRKTKVLRVGSSCDRVAQIEKLGADHPAIMTLTSGTTGIPKIAVRTHGFLINQYNVLAAHLDFSERHIDLGTLPVFALASLAANMTTLLPDKNYSSKINAEKLAARMEAEGVTRAICSPALMANMLKHRELSELRSVYLGGGPVYPGVLDKIRKDVDLNVVYGSTEAEPIAGIRWADVSTEDKQRISGGAGLLVGQPVSGIECRIGEGNEILVSGETVLKGYLDGVGNKENKIADEGKIWHRTGDAGYFDSLGRLWLLGRVSQAISDAGGTLYPFCVECVLDAHFGIRGALLLKDGERIVVIEKGAASPDDTLDALKPLGIARIIEVKKIPMDKRHGAKIDYAKLEKAYL